MRVSLKKICIAICILTILVSNTFGQVFAEETAYPQPPEIMAGGAILMDADTGAILYEKDAYSQYYPASITKIMTCLLAVEKLSLDQTITFTGEVFEALPWDAALLGVQRGETLTVRDCLYGLMLRSGNEVAVALAMEIAGTEEAFGEMMTERAKEMGALNTVFTNASGLYQDTHYTTPYDMAVITKEAIKNGTFVEVWGKDYYTMSATNVSDEYEIANRHNMLISSRAEYYEYAEGGKTGYEELAKRTLVTHAKKDGQSLICVVMYDETEYYYSDTEALFDYGFSNFKKVRVLDEENRFGENDGFINIPDTDYVTIPKNMMVSDLEYELTYLTDNSSGNIADIKYYCEGHYLGSSKLAFVEDVDSDSGILKPTKNNKEEEKKEHLYINIAYIICALVTIIITVLIITYLVKTKQKRKIKRDRKRLFKEEGRKYKIKKRRRN